MTFTRNTIADIAEVLDRAQLEDLQISKLTTWFPRMDLEDAYAVQRAVCLRREARGDRVIGVRLPLPQRLGVAPMAHGVLHQSSICPNGAEINWLGLSEPRIAPALAFSTHFPLRGSTCTPDEVRAAIDTVMPAFDVTDCRYREWDVDSVSMIADNCYGCRVVLGQTRCTIGSLEALTEVLVARNTKRVARIPVKETLRDLLSCIATSIMLLDDAGEEIPAGSIVLCARITEPLPVAEHDRFKAFFDGLGPVRTQFVSSACKPPFRRLETIRGH